MDFRWIDWNVNHVGEHGVDPEDAELVVEQAKSPWPEWRPDDKWLVWGADREKQRYRKRNKR